METKYTEALMQAPPALTDLLGSTNMQDIRDRLARTEQNHINLKENFYNYKKETQEEFHTLSKKIDLMMDAVTGIRMVIAKWIGAGGVLIFVGQLLIDRFTG